MKKMALEEKETKEKETSKETSSPELLQKDSILDLKNNKVFMQKVEDLQKSLAESLSQKESSFVLC